MTNFKVVLIQPEIPSNTGNIGRSCVATRSELHLVGPLGFEISDRRLKRAGLDYWPYLKYKEYKNLEDWEVENPISSRTWFFSTKGHKTLYDVSFKLGDTFVFGRETKGLDKELLYKYKGQSLLIPFVGEVRSLNLANAVSVVLFEGLRQLRKF